MGDPLAPDTQIGPQARHDLRANLHRQVEESVRRGARLLLGGTLPEGPGFFYAPTVLAAVEQGMPAFDEEVFGPVAAVIRVKDEARSEEHTSELQSLAYLVCRLLLEKKKT